MAAGRSLYGPPGWLDTAILAGVALALLAVGFGAGWLVFGCR